MRHVLGFLAMVAASGSAAAQSSIVAVKPIGAQAGPSMLVATGETAGLPSPSVTSAPEHPAVAASETRLPSADGATPSITRLGTPPPPVAGETVAAIPKKAGPPALPEMVIRGGIVGDAFPTQPDEEAVASEASGAAQVEDAEEPLDQY